MGPRLSELQRFMAADNWMVDGADPDNHRQHRQSHSNNNNNNNSNNNNSPGNVLPPIGSGRECNPRRRSLDRREPPSFPRTRDRPTRFPPPTTPTTAAAAATTSPSTTPRHGPVIAGPSTGPWSQFPDHWLADRSDWSITSARVNRVLRTSLPRGTHSRFRPDAGPRLVGPR